MPFVLCMSSELATVISRDQQDSPTLGHTSLVEIGRGMLAQRNISKSWDST